MERRDRGFTVIELMVVVTLIGMLAGIAAPLAQRTMQRGREAVLRHDLHVMRRLIQQHKVDKKRYPDSLQALVDEGYLYRLPPDTITDSAATWVEVRNEPADPEDADADTGVADVKSGAAGADLDGVLFADL